MEKISIPLLLYNKGVGSFGRRGEKKIQLFCRDGGFGRGRLSVLGGLPLSTSHLLMTAEKEKGGHVENGLGRSKVGKKIPLHRALSVDGTGQELRIYLGRAMRGLG